MTNVSVRLLLLLQLLLLPRTSLLERWRLGTLCICLTKNIFAFESIAAHLMQEIQFLEFMGGSNSTHAHLICMRFIWINMVLPIECASRRQCIWWVLYWALSGYNHRNLHLGMAVARLTYFVHEIDLCEIFECAALKFTKVAVYS